MGFLGKNLLVIDLIHNNDNHYHNMNWRLFPSEIFQVGIIVVIESTDRWSRSQDMEGVFIK